MEHADVEKALARGLAQAHRLPTGERHAADTLAMADLIDPDQVKGVRQGEDGLVEVDRGGHG